MYPTLTSLQNQNNTFSNFNQRPTYQPNREVKVYNAPSTTTTKPSHSNVSPQVWGRPLWFSFHFGALNYPDDADDEKKQMMINFILGIPLIIPCDVCKNHAYDYIQSRKNNLYNIVQNSHTLFRFFWEFHNDVNKRNGKPTMTLEAVYNLYRTNPSTAL